jgi:hypothetical protein
MLDKEAYVYLWTDVKTHKKYLGTHKHKGNRVDGYVSSSDSFNSAFQQRPWDFQKQILVEGTSAECYAREQRWFRLIEEKTGISLRRNQDWYNGKSVNGYEDTAANQLIRLAGYYSFVVPSEQSEEVKLDRWHQWKSDAESGEPEKQLGLLNSFQEMGLDTDSWTVRNLMARIADEYRQSQKSQ